MFCSIWIPSHIFVPYVVRWLLHVRVHDPYPNVRCEHIMQVNPYVVNDVSCVWEMRFIVLLPWL